MGTRPGTTDDVPGSRWLDFLTLDPPTATGRPAVRLCMVQSIDGSAAIDGVSGALGGDADREFFLACRSLADVVLVGAGTIRAEGYGPARLTPDLIAARRRRGQDDVPPIAVVSHSMGIDLTSDLFRRARPRPIIITWEGAPTDRIAAARAAADVIVAGRGGVDLDAALARLWESGHRLVGCEGGPSLNAALVRAARVDEIALSVALTLVGDGPRIVTGGFAPVDMSVHSMLSEDDGLFLRLRPRTRSGPPAAGARK